MDPKCMHVKNETPYAQLSTTMSFKNWIVVKQWRTSKNLFNLQLFSTCWIKVSQWLIMRISNPCLSFWNFNLIPRNTSMMGLVGELQNTYKIKFWRLLGLLFKIPTLFLLPLMRSQPWIMHVGQMCMATLCKIGVGYHYYWMCRKCFLDLMLITWFYISWILWWHKEFEAGRLNLTFGMFQCTFQGLKLGVTFQIQW